MEPESSLSHSQVRATCPYPEPDQSSLYPHIPLPEDPSWYLPTIYSWVFHVVSFHRLHHQNPVYNSALPIQVTCPGHLTIFHVITWALVGDEYISLSKSLSSFLHPPVTSSLLSPNILLRSLFSNILSLCSSLSVSDQVSHPYKETSTIKFCIS